MQNPQTESLLLKPNRPVGIIGYGAYVPRYRLPNAEIARVWKDGEGGGPVKEKSVPGSDEDVITMSIEAARNALQRAWSMGWPFHARRRLAGYRLTATDADWAAGDGPRIAGTTVALLLLATGRVNAALPLLHGPGVPLLTSSPSPR